MDSMRYFSREMVATLTAPPLVDQLARKPLVHQAFAVSPPCHVGRRNIL